MSILSISIPLPITQIQCQMWLNKRIKERKEFATFVLEFVDREAAVRFEKERRRRLGRPIKYSSK